MKTLIALGFGIALGLAFKKPEKIKEPKFIVIDDRSSLDEHLFDDEAKGVFKKYLETHKPCL